MRFDLVDRVLERGERRVVTLKAVTVAEEYLADHFPGFAVLPGVMMMEALVQAGRALARGDADAPAGPKLVLREARNVRYGNMVRPGQSLVVEVELTGRDGDAWQFKGTGRVDEHTAVQAKFTLAPPPVG